MLIVLIVAVVLVLSITFAAIFRQSNTIDRMFTVSNFSAESVVWFEKNVGGDTVTISSDNYEDSYGIRASVDPIDDNYIGNLHAKVRYKGAGVGLIRVRMVEEWSTTKSENNQLVRVVQPYRLDLPYNLSPSAYSGSGANQQAWLDNRASDYCFYYTTPVYSSGTSELPLIEGVDTDSIDLGVLPSDTVVHVLFETDAVQVNRYPQYWGMTSLPWTGTSAQINTGVTPADDVTLATVAP